MSQPGRELKPYQVGSYTKVYILTPASLLNCSVLSQFFYLFFFFFHGVSSPSGKVASSARFGFTSSHFLLDLSPVILHEFIDWDIKEDLKKTHFNLAIMILAGGQVQSN